MNITKNARKVFFRNEKTYFYNISGVILRIIFISVHTFFSQRKGVVVHDWCVFVQKRIALISCENQTVTELYSKYYFADYIMYTSKV